MGKRLPIDTKQHDIIGLTDLVSVESALSLLFMKLYNQMLVLIS